jgi:hypothetical protein
VLINQYIKHIQRGGIDTVRVADYLWVKSIFM